MKTLRTKSTQPDLKRLIKESGRRVDWIARQLGLSYIYCHLIINGKRKASVQRARITALLQNDKSPNSKTKAA